MGFVLALVGLVIGAAIAQDAAGAVFGAAIGAMAAMLRTQAARLHALEEALERLERGEARQTAAPVDAYPTRVYGPPAPATRPTPRADPFAEPTPAPTAAPLPAAAPTPAVARVAPPVASPVASPVARPVSQPDAFDQAARRARDWLLGGNTVAKAGIAILFVGLAFLAKYAAEHAVLPVEARLAAIGLVAAALLVLGWRWRATRRGYAHVLQGGAIAVWYLTLFAAFRLYGVLAAGPVFALMLAVAALAAVLAVLQDAPALAVIGALGGYATPLLLSTGHGEPLALFSYYLVLDLGVAAVAWARTWRRLNLVAFAFTYGVGGAWGLFSYTDAHFAMSETFVVLYFLLFNAILLLPARRAGTTDETDAEKGGRWVHGTLLFGLPTVTFALQHGLLHDTRFGTALSALALAAFYLVLARALRRRAAWGLAFDGALAVAIVFTALVMPFALDARDTAGAWSLEGAGLVWLGVRQDRRVPRAFGLLLLVLPAFAMIVAGLGALPPPSSPINGWALNALLAAVACTVGAFALASGRATGRVGAAEGVMEPVLVAGAVAWALFGAGLDIDRFVDAAWRSTAWVATFATIALACTGLRTRLGWPTIGAPAAGLVPLLGLVLLREAVADVDPHPLRGWGLAAWPFAVAVQWLVLRRVAKDWTKPLQAAVHALGPLVLALLGGLEGGHVSSAWGDAGSAWPWIGALAVPALVLAALLREDVARRWPIGDAPAAYRLGAAGVLSAVLAWGTLAADATSTGAASPLPWLPLLNPLDLGSAAVLLATWAWSRALAGGAAFVPARAVWAVVAFAALNAVLLRAFFHWGGVAYDADAWLHSASVQAGLAVLWTALALVVMGTAARRVSRPAWAAGAGLLGLVVLKLLVIDLAASGTVMRIVAFIGVGALMLVIGYVAPLPARAEPRATEEVPDAA